jgi:F0F1-type ATP synthase membrane subunit b/b'
MMAFLGSQEIILIVFTGLLLLAPLLIVVAIIYFFVKGYQSSQLKSRDDRIKVLEDKIEKLEKERTTDVRQNSLENKMNERK